MNQARFFQRVVPPTFCHFTNLVPFLIILFNNCIILGESHGKIFQDILYTQGTETLAEPFYVVLTYLMLLIAHGRSTKNAMILFMCGSKAVGVATGSRLIKFMHIISGGLKFKGCVCLQLDNTPINCYDIAYRLCFPKEIVIIYHTFTLFSCKESPHYQLLNPTHTHTHTHTYTHTNTHMQS